MNRHESGASVNSENKQYIAGVVTAFGTCNYPDDAPCVHSATDLVLVASDGISGYDS